MSPSRRFIPGLVALIAVVLLAAVLLGVGGASPSAPNPWHATLTRWVERDDPADQGRLQNWSLGRFGGAAVRAPFVPNAGHVTGDAGIASHNGMLSWFRTRLNLPEDGRYALEFQSVNHRAHVWLDGRSLGGHTGVYQPFQKRFGARKGVHTLVVRADYRDPLKMKAEAWHRTWFNFGGINRPVTIRRLADVDLVAPAVTTRLRPDGAAVVDIDVHVRNYLPENREFEVNGSLTHDGQSIDIPLPNVQVGPRGWRVARTQIVIDKPALWSPDAPNLYDLHLEVPGQTSYNARTGLRDLVKRGVHLYLNGRRLALHGASINEDAPGRGDALTPADMDAIVSELKAIHANSTRSQHALSPALLDRFDKAGIMVWQGVGPVDAPGAWTSTTPARQRAARERVLTSVNQLRLHPSIIAWSLANEVAGDGHPGGQAAYVDDMAQELHRRDPGRVVSVDVWGNHTPSNPNVRLYRHLDAVGTTNYVGWYEATREPRAVVAKLVRASVASFEAAFPGKVVVVTEFGAEASAANPRLEPGGFGFQTRLLATHLRAYKGDDRLSGMLIWALRDFAVAPSFAGGSIHRLVPEIKIVKGVNQKGLYDYIGRPKPSVHMVGQAYARLATFPDG
jgi:hypothetical protein